MTSQPRSQPSLRSGCVCEGSVPMEPGANGAPRLPGFINARISGRIATMAARSSWRASTSGERDDSVSQSSDQLAPLPHALHFVVLGRADACRRRLEVCHVRRVAVSATLHRARSREDDRHHAPDDDTAVAKLLCGLCNSTTRAATERHSYFTGTSSPMLYVIIIRMCAIECAMSAYAEVRGPRACGADPP